MADAFDVAVIGGGPGGYVAAIRAAQLGFKVACIEKEPLLGGTCLRIGCIPSKALLEATEQFHAAQELLPSMGVKFEKLGFDLAAMQKRKDEIVAQFGQGVAGLLGKNKIKNIRGHAKLVATDRIETNGDSGKSEIVAKNVILATGSKPKALRGVDFDGARIGSSTEALAYSQVPKHLICIGAGAIGLELGSVWRRLGAKVTVLEYFDRILPEMDLELAREALRSLQKQGMEFKLGVKVGAAKVEGNEVVVSGEGFDPVRGDRVLVSVGRVPNVENLGLESVGVRQDKLGRVEVNDHLQTSVPNIYAIGDLVRGPMLAHKAEEEGVAVAEYLATGYGHVNYDVIPGVVYTAPEVAGVGKTEQQLNDAGIPFRRGVFHFRANARARVIGATEGFAKVLAHAETDRILGVHIIGARAGDMIAEACVAMECGASAEDLARTCHAHPSVPEALKEAALAVDKRAIHQ